VRPAECKLNVATLGQLAIAGVAIDLQDPLEACQCAAFFMRILLIFVTLDYLLCRLSLAFTTK
jgi:hypothetical protein